MMILKSLVFSAIFATPALLLLLLAVYITGGTRLACQRIESTHIDCTLATIGWLGQVNVNEILLKRVQEAKLNSYDCSTSDSQGNRRPKQCQTLTIVTATEEVYQPDLPPSAAAEINTFLASTQPSLTVEKQRPLNLAFFCFALFFLLASIIFTQVVLLMSRTRRSARHSPA